MIVPELPAEISELKERVARFVREEVYPIEAAIAGIPSSVPLERASEIHLTDAGGGALQWVLHAPSTNWSLQATLWPGSLHLFVHDADDDEEQLYRARATRDQEYYRRKYPLETK